MSYKTFGQHISDIERVMTRADIETSFMGKSRAKVEKNWQNAAHFHWVLKSARFSEADAGDGGRIVCCDEGCAAKLAAVERLGIQMADEQVLLDDWNSVGILRKDYQPF